MRAAHEHLITLFLNFRRSVAKVGDGTVFDPGAAAVDARRVAAFAIKGYVEFFALANRIRGGFLLGRFRHRRNFDVRVRKGHTPAKLKSIETNGAALGFGRGHGPRGSKQART